MARSGNQKQKILYLMQMLVGCQGEENALPMRDIMEALEQNQIHAERKSIYDDMETLRGFGFPIRYSRKRPGGYYMEGELPEFLGHLASESQEEQAAKVQEETVSEEEASEETFEVWKDDGEEREVKLTCPVALAGRVRAYLDGPLKVKEKKDGMISVTGRAVPGEAFYGWLTYLGPEAKLTKPKKESAAYQEYLKGILKRYKEK